MGKVLSSFENGYAGAIARSLDDVVISLANRNDTALAFGVPVALSEDHDGVVAFDGSSHTAADFIGVTVRNPSKTPDTYGGDTATYEENDLVDVLVRGHIIVRMTGSNIQPGSSVSINKSTGKFSVNTGDNFITLANAHVSSAADTSGMTEIVLNTRNVI